ncbi:Alkaline phosphatase family protein OS=Streptomyces aurantiogriseus OX=66870 GN=GCM10010251_56750 PE=4 SV=1 [Streptomyces aurantiogriseus]
MPGIKARAAAQVARKKLGMRYRIQTVPLDPSGVRGSHGRLPQDPQDSPVLLCSRPLPAAPRDEIHATEVKDLLLGLAGLTTP